MTHLMVSHLKRPYHDCLEGMMRANQMATKAGDIELRFLSRHAYCLTYFQCGLQLGLLQKTCVTSRKPCNAVRR
jgi:hypothetical protein